MFNGLGSLSSLMKGASELRTQMGQIDQQLRQKRVEGSAGGSSLPIRPGVQRHRAFQRRHPESQAGDHVQGV